MPFPRALPCGFQLGQVRRSREVSVSRVRNSVRDVGTSRGELRLWQGLRNAVETSLATLCKNQSSSGAQL